MATGISFLESLMAQEPPLQLHVDTAPGSEASAKSHKASTIQCQDCGKDFSRKSDLERHWRPGIPCPREGCISTFREDKIAAFRSHLRKEHRHRTSGISDIDMEGMDK